MSKHFKITRIMRNYFRYAVTFRSARQLKMIKDNYCERIIFTVVSVYRIISLLMSIKKKIVIEMRIQWWTLTLGWLKCLRFT